MRVEGRLLVLVAAALAVSCGARSSLLAPPSNDATALPEAGDDASSDVPGEPTPFDCRINPSMLCDDANACTTDRCNADGTCSHVAIVCDDGDPCTANDCDETRGCTFPMTECGGCADGQREAFGDRARYPNIAGCSGGFEIPGLARPTAPTCGRAAGNNGPNPAGSGCAASDLCAPMWHVCTSAADVAMHSADGCAGASDAPSSAFYASRQTGPGCLECATGTATDCTNNDCRSDCATTSMTTNDIFGCGNIGSAPQPSCAPLDRSGNNLCSALPAPWSCNSGSNADVNESEVVVKPGSESGGVLCCRD